MSELGQMLRNRRKERGITLKDIEGALSIRVKYLEALEEGNYAIIPGEVYAKGFLRNYASFLGFNAEDMVELYKKETQPSENPEEEQNNRQSLVEERKRRKGSGRSFGFRAIISLVAAALGAYFIYAFTGDKVPSENAKIPPTGTMPPIAPSAQDIAAPKTQDVSLAVKATADCWVMVVIDETEKFEGILHNGDNKSWKAKNKIDITVGNAGGVEITFNEQRQASLGAVGEVAHRVYTRQ